VFVAALTVPVDDPALLLVPAVLLRAGWLIFDSDRHRARVPAESASMNKLRPLNKLRYPGYSAQGGVWPTGRYSRRHRMARHLLSLRPVAV
jgi:hypothetical protein